MTPVEVVRMWFEAHARGDLDAASLLMSDDVGITVPGARLRGFRAFMDWYDERRATEGPTFAYRLDDLLSGETHAAAVLTLSAAGRQWRQVALYEVAGERITTLWAAESDI